MLSASLRTFLRSLYFQLLLIKHSPACRAALCEEITGLRALDFGFYQKQRPLMKETPFRRRLPSEATDGPLQEIHFWWSFPGLQIGRSNLLREELAQTSLPLRSL